MDTNELWYKHVLKLKNRRLARGQAIKNYCHFECCAGDYESWKNCTITNCFLYRFRMGKEENPVNKKCTSKTIACSSNSTKNEVLEESNAFKGEEKE